MTAVIVGRAVTIRGRNANRLPSHLSFARAEIVPEQHFLKLARGQGAALQDQGNAGEKLDESSNHRRRNMPEYARMFDWAKVADNLCGRNRWAARDASGARIRPEKMPVHWLRTVGIDIKARSNSASTMATCAQTLYTPHVRAP